MDVLDFIQCWTFRPIQYARIIPPFKFEVKFKDGTRVVRKDNLGLRVWKATNEFLEYAPLVDDTTQHCTVTEVGYYELVGFRAGDAIVFWNADGIENPILFSEP